METNELLKMIGEYFDGELEKSKEQNLFISLSADEQARNYFRQNRLLKSVTSEMQEAFPEEVEKKILSKTVQNQSCSNATQPASTLGRRIQAVRPNHAPPD